MTEPEAGGQQPTVEIDLALFDAAIFDLDGVVTRTASVHAAAWKELFDAYLGERAARTGEPFRPFELEDYRRFVDGKPRYDGVKSFLASRGIELAWGSPDDDPEAETICGLGNRKNLIFNERLRQGGAEIFEPAVDFLRAVRARGLKTALVSSSRNTDAVLAAAGLAGLFDVVVDGNEAARLGLKGKPAPDTYLHAARLLGVRPDRVVAAEDALAGVQSQKAAGFALVIGVGSGGAGEELRRHGADIVIGGFEEIRLAPSESAAGGAGLADAPQHETSWTLAYEGFDPAREALREALCTLGNGYFATRGAGEAAEAGEVHYPGTYLAGGYNRLKTEIAGRVVENEDLVNLPNWLCLSFRRPGGDWLSFNAVDVLAYRQVLDLKAGLLHRTVRFRDRDGGETTLESRRLVHMAEPHLAAIEWTIRPENWSGPIEVRSALDGRVINAGVERYRSLATTHLVPLYSEALGEDAMLLVVETSQSHLRVAEAARTRIFRDGEALPVERRTQEEPGYITQHLSFAVEAGRAAVVEKIVALHTSRDRAISSPDLASAEAVAAAPRFEALADSQRLAWSHLWRRCNVKLEGHERTQMILRLHIFHLLQTVSWNTAELDAGVPARGLHGEAYRGHIFWDELFIFPFLNLRIPELTRSLLRYRHRRLPQARRMAAEAGFRGAMYPWQSGSDGREESQVVHLNPRSGRWIADNSWLQRHVNSAIAHNIWRYWDVTGDRDFMACYGTEMMLEIARFWASAAAFDDRTGRYGIKGVMGPDEFHDAYPWANEPGLENNAYTNVMAAWVLAHAPRALELVEKGRRRELRERLALSDEELERWDEVSRRLVVPFHGDGIVSQFEGYERLEELDWEAYRAKYGDIRRLDRILEAEGDSVNRYKASKQADVLMLFYLFSAEELTELFARLGYGFDSGMIPKNVDYYLHRTSDGSTLSAIVHSWVLARSDRARSWGLLKEALESDIADVQGGTTPEGIHLGAMAGTVDLVQRGQTGLVIREDFIRLNPCLPEELQGLKLCIRYRGSWLELDLTCDRMVVAAPDGWSGPDRIMIRDSWHDFGPGRRLEFDCHLEEDGWRPCPPAHRG
jgi:alpha,alpha-trehalase